MLTVVVAQPGTNNYTLADGETLEVQSDYDEPLRVTFAGAGRVNVRGGADLANARFDVDPSGTLGETRVVFYGNSTAASVTYVGAGNQGGVYLQNGSDVGNVVIDASSDQGHAAQTLLRLANGSTTQDIAFFGGRGRDLMLIGGNVASGNISANLGAGRDLVRFDNTATVQDPDQPVLNDPFDGAIGQITLQTGSGDDTIDFRGGRYDNFAVDTGGGNDRVLFNGDSPEVRFSGEVDVLTGNGDDIIESRGNTKISRAATFEAGAGDDLIRLRNLTGNGPLGAALTIDAGVNGTGRDFVQVGNLSWNRQTLVRWGRDFVYTELAANTYGDPNNLDPVNPVLDFDGGSDFSTATIRLLQRSTVSGAFAYTSPSKTSLVAENLDVAGFSGRTTIQTGGRNDSIRLTGGSSGGSLRVDTGDGNDAVTVNGGQFIGESASFITGSGRDRVRLYNARSAGNVNVDFDGDLGGGTSFLQLRDLEVGNVGDLNVDFAGRLKIEELEAVTGVFGYDITEKSGSPFTGQSPLSFVGNADSRLGRFELTTTSAASVVFPGTLTDGGAIQTGALADRIDFSGSTVTGALDIRTGGQADTVRLTDATVGDITVDLGSDDDLLDNLGTDFIGSSTLNGAGGTDTAASNNGNLVNFEIVH